MNIFDRLTYLANKLLNLEKEIDWVGANLELLKLEDYALYFPQSEEFKEQFSYRDTQSGKWTRPVNITLEEFLEKRESYQVKPSRYFDSRYLTSTILDYFSDRQLAPILVLDVGSYLGTFSIEQALLAKYEQIDLKIYAFEPGPIFPILQKNIQLNGLTGTISCENLAVSNVNELIAYEYVPGQLIAGGVGVFDRQENLASKVCKSITIDSFLQKHKKIFSASQSLMIKLDCQGIEPKVYQGCKDLLSANIPLVFISEFLCWSFEEFHEFYKPFLADFFIIDVGSATHNDDQEFSLIENNNFDDYVRELSNTSKPWTDLVLIPKIMKKSDLLVAQILAKPEKG